jgi:NAD(P)H-dependent flavin oxidoreductase YrpB (nitropropane dioxygenase family)
MMDTGFTKLLAIKFPIMQAPIGGAAGPELAASVSNCGALGSVAVWFLAPAQAALCVDATLKLTSKPFAVNIRADLNLLSHVTASIESGAKLIHLFWGDPTPYASTIHRAGARFACTVANAEEAKQALDAGADILIAQGWEAGGHVRGTLTTLTLVPTVVDLAGSVPVLAAGGISDGRGLAAMLTLGASGVVMGTRFVASEESRAHPEYKKAITTAGQSDAVYLNNLFDVGWPNAPHRVLRNSTVRAWEGAASPPSGSRPNEKEVVAWRPDGAAIQRYSVSLPMAGMTGNVEALAHYAGQCVEGIKEVLPAAKIVETTVHQAREQLSKCKA